MEGGRESEFVCASGLVSGVCWGRITVSLLDVLPMSKVSNTFVERLQAPSERVPKRLSVMCVSVL